MPFISEAASAIKNRLGFRDQSDSIRATPNHSKSVSRENLSQHSAIRSLGEFGDDSRGDTSSSTLALRSFELPEDTSFWKDHNVQVIIRLRPLSASEISVHGHHKCVKQESHQTITWTGHPESRFTFDVVADETVTQEKLFKVAGVPMVENCVGGYNSCVFAYGQTGSGKTHTMLGDVEGGTRRHSVNSGMTPRVFEYLFSRIQKEKDARREEKLRFTCKCSFLEIYNEQILDLLNPSSVNLQIREDLKKGVYVENLTEVEVQTATQAMQQLLEGATNRKVAATNMNHASSRSHSVFTCVIESSWESQGVTHHRFARLNLVDLAGSERQKSSGAEGERLKEATNINKSLSTLGLVIMNLVSMSNGKTQHVPYRDSKLTFLLQDSLGGNSKTCIIANISPSNSCSLETLSTLKFAQRAKFIKNNAIINEDASGDVIAMRMQIQQLKKEVSRLRGLTGGAETAESDTLSMGVLGSPGTGAFKWEGLGGGMFSPFTSDNKLAQKKEFEVALVGAFRREKDKDQALQALTAENQAAMQLAKQREDEIQGLKMRLRFRESAVKRLEAVVSGKISAETYLQKEREEHLKEIEVLRSQADRNQEVTRFAMENLRLKGEIKRLKSFYEEGERERMNDQIMILENKLLEALDWKLMHESNPSMTEKGSPGLISDDQGKSSPLASNNKEMQSTWKSSMSDENEFLRMQAILNQSEMDLIKKKLDKCLDEKQTLERQVKDLEAHVEEIRSRKITNKENSEMQIGFPSREEDLPITSLNDQAELKAMVDAIAVASQREVEAHEMKVTLGRENDELRTRIKILIDDNNKLIELYERAAAELKNKTEDAIASDVKDNEAEKIQDLKRQLVEMREENDKLMSLYEKAMLERDEFRGALSAREHGDVDREEFDWPEKLAAIGGASNVSAVKDNKAEKIQDLELQLMEMREDNEKLMARYEKAMQDRDELRVALSAREHSEDTKKDVDGAASDVPEVKDNQAEKIQDLEHQLMEIREENEKLMVLYEKAMHERDEFSAAVSAAKEQCEAEDSCQKQLVEVEPVDISQVKDNEAEKMQYLEHQLMEMREENEKLMELYEKAMHERDELRGALSAKEHSEIEDTKEIDCLEKQVVTDWNSNNEQLVKAAVEARIKKMDSDVSVRREELINQTEDASGHCNTYSSDVSEVKNTEAEKIQYLEHQLREKHEENEKLTGLYEKAMQEWDEFRKSEPLDCQEKIAADENKDQRLLMNGPLISKAALTKYMQFSTKQEVEGVTNSNSHEGQRLIPEDCPTDEQVTEENSAMEIDRDISVRMELDKAEEKLSSSSQRVEQLGLIEKSVLVVDELSKQIDSTNHVIQANQQEFESLKLQSWEMQERRDCMDKKFSALRLSMSNVSSTLAYFEEREVRARARVYASAVYQNQVKEKLSSLQDQKSEIESAQRKMEETEAELRSNLASLKSKMEEENRIQESEKVLFAIDNIERVENWKPVIKATDLLKSEEEKTKLQSVIKLYREKLGVVTREIDHSRSRLQKLETGIQRVSLELQKANKSTEEMELALCNLNSEQQILLDVCENGKVQADEMIVDYQECTFLVCLNKEERDMLEEELQQMSMNLEKMQKDRTEVTKRMTELVDGRSGGCLVSEEMRSELEDVVMTLHQAKMLLE